MTISPADIPRVLVFCGASPSRAPVYEDAARAFGAAVASHGWGIVYGGHHAGMMGAVAEGCLHAGGPVTGILPGDLVGKEIPPEGIELVRVTDMHARKALMVERSRSIVALPGGYGTLDELFEQLTWRMIGKHEKPIGILDVIDDGQSYWAPMLTFLEHATAVGFVRPQARALFVPTVDVEALAASLCGQPEASRFRA